MRYVIVRDDDTNALTPVKWLDTLYRPFLERNLPVNLAVIPEVSTRVTLPDGRPEGFLVAKNGTTASKVSLAENKELVEYLRANPGYHLLQHGCHHDYFEFDMEDPGEIRKRLDHGARIFAESGFSPPETFVAPHDKLSRQSYREVRQRFSVISTGWFELDRLPRSWWPQYIGKKLTRAPHWRVRNTALLSHPGCLLSCYRCYETMLGEVRKAVESQKVTVLVTHWWEYFRNNKPDEEFISILHDTARFLAEDPDIKVISFRELADQQLPLN